MHFLGFDQIRQAQNIAKDAYLRMLDEIVPGMSEAQVRKRFEIHLIDLGSFNFWRYGIGATVHVGERTTQSATCRAYRQTDTIIKDNDILVMDIAPSVNFYWGDFSRTIFLENGQVVKDHAKLKTPEYIQGIAVEKEIHRILCQVAKPDMSFEQLFFIMEEHIARLGYKNLDFGRNLGHSVELDQNDRRVLKAGNTQKLSQCDCFTFEPHIAKTHGNIGFKRENIYYFEGNTLKELI